MLATVQLMHSRHSSVRCPKLGPSAEISILRTGFCQCLASRICAAVVLLPALVLSACDGGKGPRPVHFDFDALFQPLDTVRLDHTVPLTSFRYVDISDAGEILVIDDRGMMTLELHVFSESGTFIRTLDVADCDPGADFQPMAARFVGQSHIVSTSARGPTYLFNENGKCVAAGRTTMHMSIEALCSTRDTIFSQQWVTPRDATIMAYSPLLVALDTFKIQPPRFPWFHMRLAGNHNRRFGCFDDGPWYVFGESEDAMPLRSYGGAARYRPQFFAAPTRDAPGSNDIEGLFAVLGESTLTSALFELSATARLVVFRDGRRNGNQFEAAERGLMIVEHGSNGNAVSTVSQYVPMAARNGVAYFVGEAEQLPYGDEGNRTLLRFKFVPP